MSYTAGQTQTVYIRNDNLLRLVGLQNIDGESYQNAATVTVTIKDRAGVLLTGQDQPISLAYVADSNGEYSGLLYKELEWELNEPYIAEVKAVSGGLTAIWLMRLTARNRPITN